MKKIIFCGGGSAGHVIPNIALYENLKEKYEISYMGTNGIEKEICGGEGLRFEEFGGVKYARGAGLKNLSIPFRLAKSVSECKKILKKECPDLLFCKGGYVSLSPALAAFSLKIPVVTHESDLTLGLANRIISKRCEKVFTSFSTTAQKLKNGVYTGSPIRKELFGRNRLKAKERLCGNLRPTVLVFGGGSGSKIINETLRSQVFRLCDEYNVVHICGKGNMRESNVKGYIQIEFARDMGLIYACADYAVARCGSNSAHELIALKIPTLFIPLENGASRGDQVANAEYFKERGLCRVLKEKELSDESLIENINALSRDNYLKAALKNDVSQCGNERICKEITSILR